MSVTSIQRLDNHPCLFNTVSKFLITCPKIGVFVKRGHTSKKPFSPAQIRFRVEEAFTDAYINLLIM